MLTKTYMILVFFSKAFDKVPHDGLLSKLKHYGIDDKNLAMDLLFSIKKKTGYKVS